MFHGVAGKMGCEASERVDACCWAFGCMDFQPTEFVLSNFIHEG